MYLPITAFSTSIFVRINHCNFVKVFKKKILILRCIVCCVYYNYSADMFFMSIGIFVILLMYFLAYEQPFAIQFV